MSSVADAGGRPPSTVFLSYASEDRQAARQIGDALSSYGLELWYDESELGGGDVWDQKIRKQIRDCDYFMALVSSQTDARHEGYFRREWRLAVERTLDMADDHTFLLPIAIDDIDQTRARVPEKFHAVQWLRVPRGEPTAAFEALCRRLISGQVGAPLASKRATPRASQPTAPAPDLPYPEFPRQEPGQRMRFLFAAAGWGLRSGWLAFKRLPRWLRVIASIWIVTGLLSKSCTPSHHAATDISPTDAAKLKAISEQYRGSSNAADLAKLSSKVAREFANDLKDPPVRHTALLALPFAAALGDASAAQLADSTFAEVYGRISIAHPGQVGLPKHASAAPDMNAALEQGRANHSTYILSGAVEKHGTAQSLAISIVTVADGTVRWARSYPVTGADPAKIAAEVSSNVPSLEED